MTTSHAPVLGTALELVGHRLSVAQVAAVAAGRLAAVLHPEAYRSMVAAVRVVQDAVAHQRTAYGINTGFGRLATVRLADADLLALQVNLVRSHACGVGPALSTGETRAIMLLRANALAAGHSGVRPALVECLLRLLELGVHPIVPSRGSVGASGDLAPLAHVALVVIGEGEVEFGGERMTSAEAHARIGLTPQVLRPKEGLALLNGTQAMTAVGVLALHRAMRVVALADLAGAMTHQALLGTTRGFEARIQDLRPHPGQRTSAARLRRWLDGSEVEAMRPDGSVRVQDAYSLRCMPQVHGAVRGAIDHVREVLEIETGSVTDNPLVFAEDDDIVSGGNFHGAPLALALDYAAIALTDLISLIERRIERLVNPDLSEGLPPFLTESPGVSSGFMIAHVTAAALLSEVRVLAHPASVDNVPTSAGQEDHVSMGMTSANKLRAVVEQAERVLAIELLAAAQALDLRGLVRMAPEVRLAHETVRTLTPEVGADRALGAEIEALAAALATSRFDRWATGPLIDGGNA